MTITFQNENDVIVYALEKIIRYARKHQYIFVAQSVWWIALVTGLTKGLITHIDNLRIRSEAGQAPAEVEPPSLTKETVSGPQDHFIIDTRGSQVHPERIPQVDNTINDSYEVESCESEPDRATLILRSTRKFIDQSRKERQVLRKKPCVLSRTRSGKIPVKSLTKKQRNRLQAISKDTLSAYLGDRECNLQVREITLKT